MKRRDNSVLLKLRSDFIKRDKRLIPRHDISAAPLRWTAATAAVMNGGGEFLRLLR